MALPVGKPDDKVKVVEEAIKRRSSSRARSCLRPSGPQERPRRGDDRLAVSARCRHRALHHVQHVGRVLAFGDLADECR